MATTGATTAPCGPVGPLPRGSPSGVLGAVGMVVSGSAIGSIPRPVGDNWWYTVPIGTGLGAHLAFYASVGLLLAGWVGLGAHAYRGRLSVRMSWLVLGPVGPALLPRRPRCSAGTSTATSPRVGWPPGDSTPTWWPPRPSATATCCPRSPSVWRGTASPYGPLFVSVSHAGASVSGVLAGGPHPRLPGHRAGRGGPADGVAAGPGPPPGQRPGDRPVAGRAQPAGPVQLRLVGPQRRPHDGPDAGRDHPRHAGPAAMGGGPVRPGRHHQAPGAGRGGLPGRRRVHPGGGVGPVAGRGRVRRHHRRGRGRR